MWMLNCRANATVKSVWFNVPKPVVATISIGSCSCWMSWTTRKSSRIGTAIPPTPSTITKSYRFPSAAKAVSMLRRSMSLSSILAATEGANGFRRKTGLMMESSSSTCAVCLRNRASAVSPVLIGFITPTVCPSLFECRSQSTRDDSFPDFRACPCNKDASYHTVIIRPTALFRQAQNSFVYFFFCSVSC